MTKMKKLFSVAMAIVMALSLFTACGNNIEETNVVSFFKITLPEEAIEAKVGEVIDLEDYTTFWTDVPDLTKEELDEAIDALGLVWTVADETVATVDENGVLTAVAEGETEITVVSADEEFSATGKVSVLPADEAEGEDVEGDVQESPAPEVDSDKNDDTSAREETPVSSTENVNDNVTTPVATPTPTPTPAATPAATPTPVATPTPTPTPEVKKCGSVGHSTDGTCSVCGSTYTTPKCGAVGHTSDGTCGVCGAVKSTPKCGSVGHTVDGTCDVCGAVKTTPKCGAVGHSADGTCAACGSTYSSPKCGTIGHSVGGTCPVCGATKALDNNQENEYVEGDHTGNGGDATDSEMPE